MDLIFMGQGKECGFYYVYKGKPSEDFKVEVKILHLPFRKITLAALWRTD